MVRKNIIIQMFMNTSFQDTGEILVCSCLEEIGRPF